MQGKAQADGWRLVTVIDNGSAHPYLMVADAGKFSSDQVAGLHVLRNAQVADGLHRHALQIVMASRIKSKGK